MKDAIYSTKQIDQDKKIGIPNNPLINSSTLILAIIQLKIKETTPMVFFFSWGYERWESILSILLAAASRLYILIFTFKCVSPLYLASYFIYKGFKRQRIFVGGGGNPHQRSRWVLSYLFTIINIKNLAFGPALLDDERHLEEKGLLSLFSNFFCLHQCFILTFHSSLPLFPFSTVIAFRFGNK